MHQLNLIELAKFIVTATKEGGFASGKSGIKTADGGIGWYFNDGNYFYQDVSYGSTDFDGHIVVHGKIDPYWHMLYHGRDFDPVDKDVFNDFLQLALRQIIPERPFRGPEKFTHPNYGGYLYKNVNDGDITKSKGHDSVWRHDIQQFELEYTAGIFSLKRNL